MRVLRGMAAVAVAGGGFLTGAAPAGAISPESSGWWQKAQQVAGVPGPLPATLPVLPDSGLYVAKDPSGPFAISAVRYAAASPARLVLKVNAQNRNVGTPALLACPTTGVWNAANGGQWDARPVYDCKVSAVGKLAADGASVTFDLPGPVTTGAGDDAVVSVAIVPDGSAAPFSLALEAPGEASFTSSADASAPPASSAPFEPETQAAPDPGGFSIGETDRTFVPTGDGSFVAAPPPPTPASNGSPIDAVTGPVARQVANVVDDRTDRIFALAVLAGIFGLLWWFGARPASPRLVGSLTGGGQLALPTPQVRGIGRFARPRGTARP